MFDSNVTAKDLIEEVSGEVDIALEIDKASYIHQLNALEHFLYTEIVKEERDVTFSSEYAQYALEELNIAPDEAFVRFEDIITVVPVSSNGEGKKLTKATLIGENVFPNTFAKRSVGGKEYISCNTEKRHSSFMIYYYTKPKLKDSNNIETENVKVPVEFLDMVKAKLRGEAYKIANEDNLAAKWLNDYNVLLENFKAWMAGKAAKFGI